MADPILSEESLESFRRDGYLVLRSWYPPIVMVSLLSWVDDLAHRVPRPHGPMVYYEQSGEPPGHRILSRIEKFCEHHDGIGEFVRDPRLVGAVAQLLGEPAVLFKDKVNFKLPGGAGFKPHQDIQPGWDDYASYFISVLVTLDSSTLQNGCLELAAGQHRRGMIGERWRPLEGEALEGLVFQPVPMEPGDVAFFDCFVPHQSGPNLTAKPRRNLYLTFNRASEGDQRERYFADKRRSYPPDNEREPGREYTFRV